jgi:hypothetical protein
LERRFSVNRAVESLIGYAKIQEKIAFSVQVPRTWQKSGLILPSPEPTFRSQALLRKHTLRNYALGFKITFNSNSTNQFNFINSRILMIWAQGAPKKPDRRRWI